MLNINDRVYQVSTVDLTSENFDQIIQSNDFVIVDFWAEWCGPCKSFGPVFEQASENHNDIVFAKVNTENQMELASHFQIRSIPVLMVFRDQIVIGKVEGALSAPDLETLIEKAGTLDMDQIHHEMQQSKQD